MTGEITIDLSTGWRFGGPVTDSPTPYDWPAPELVAAACGRAVDDDGYAAVHLPHCVADLSWREWDPATWEHIFVYRRHFDRPDELAGRRVFADIGPAITNATVVLNDRMIARHAGGYLPFSVELPDLDATGNMLAVLVDGRFNLNVPPNIPVPAESRSLDYWQPAGLYGRVQLRGLPPAFLADVFAKPVDVLLAGRRVDVSCTVDAAEAVDGTVHVALSGPDGAALATAEAPASVPAGRSTVRLTLTGLSGVELWDVDNPVLYDVVATLRRGGREEHEYRTRIGFREAHFGHDGFFLNGHRLDLLGANRHGLFPYAGQAMPDRVQRRDAHILRTELNCTMVRCAHYPQSSAFLDACDELGLLVWEEAPGWQYVGDEQWRQRACDDITAMIVRDRNHPSIVVWGARLNETPDQPEFYARTQRLARELDDSRQTSGTIFEPYYRTDEFQQDVFSYDDYATEAAPDGGRQPALLPPRTRWPYLIAEAVSTRSSPTGFYRRTDPSHVLQHQALDYAIGYQAVRSDQRYCGLLAWSAFDYQSGYPTRGFRGVKSSGIADVFRIPKPGAALFQAQVDPAVRPVVQPAFGWDLVQAPAGPGPAAMICSNCDRLEVYVGGVHCATVQPDHKRFGRLAHPPSFVNLTVPEGTRPDLRIDGYVGDRLALSRQFAGDPAGDRLALTADDAALRADGADATRAVFAVVDRFGEPRGSGAGTVELELIGPAVLVGDRSIDLAATGGLGAVWVRALPGQTGEAVLTARHATLGTAQATIGLT